MEALRPLDEAADRRIGVGADDEPGYDVIPSTVGGGPERRSWRGRGRKRKRGVAFWLAVFWLLVVAFCAVAAEWLPLPDPNRPDVLDRLEG